MSYLRTSEYYRKRADEIRVAAAAPLSEEDHETLLYFASEFERLAEVADSSDESSDKPK